MQRSVKFVGRLVQGSEGEIPATQITFSLITASNARTVASSRHTNGEVTPGPGNERVLHAANTDLATFMLGLG